MAKSYYDLKPNHIAEHHMHFTGRWNREEYKERPNEYLWTFYWHCEECEWYFVDDYITPGKFRPYTEAWKSDLSVMCKGCTTGDKHLKPRMFNRPNIDYESYETV